MEKVKAATYIRETLSKEIIKEIVRQECLDELDSCENTMLPALTKVTNYYAREPYKKSITDFLVK